MSYVSPKIAAQFYNVSSETLRRWADQCKIPFKTTPGGHRRYKIIKKNNDKQKIIYARVSSSKQKRDLQRQIKYLQNKYPTYTVISDIASGLNYKRKGLRTILESLFAFDIQEVVVYAKDRLTRFGYELYEFLFEHFGATLTCVQSKDTKKYAEEIAEDILAIITVYSAKIHGKRKYHIQ